jgi:hypothetical protein
MLNKQDTVQAGHEKSERWHSEPKKSTALEMEMAVFATASPTN